MNGIDRMRLHAACLDLGLDAYEPESYSAFTYALRPGWTVIDDRAGPGIFTLAAAQRVGPSGRVVAVEPDPMARTFLERHVRWNRAEGKVHVASSEGALVGVLSGQDAPPPVLRVTSTASLFRLASLLDQTPCVVLMHLGPGESPKNLREVASLGARLGLAIHDAAGQVMPQVPGPGSYFLYAESHSPIRPRRLAAVPPRRKLDTGARRIVYVLSPGRSGSVMLARALDAHPGIRGLHEPGDPALMCRLSYEAWVGRAERAAVLAAMRRRPSSMRPEGGDRRLWVESAHWYTMLAPFLEGRFIHLIRDGRSFVRSGLQRPWYKASQSPVWRPHQLAPPPELETRLEKICWLWAEYQRATNRFFGSVSVENRFRLRVGHGDIDWAGLVERFLGLPVDPVFLDRARRIERSRPNRSTTTVAAWTEEMESVYVRLCGPVEAMLFSPEANDTAFT